MNPLCPQCEINSGTPDVYPRIKRIGHFRRKSDSKKIQRFRCLTCAKTFSLATFHPCYRQKTRTKNEIIRRLLASGVSQRRAARILSLNRKTIERKFRFLAEQARDQLEFDRLKKPRAESIQFDDLETFEHTKCKPLSVIMAVETSSRRILDFRVSQMPCKGRLSHISRKKYGYRIDKRGRARRSLFQNLTSCVQPSARIRSDSNPHYALDVRKYFPCAKYDTILGGRGSSVGGGEIKKGKFDPLFSLNHTFAKSRADISRLIRKTWSTTKRAQRLEDHLAIFSLYHNQSLPDSASGGS